MLMALGYPGASLADKQTEEPFIRAETALATGRYGEALELWNAAHEAFAHRVDKEKLCRINLGLGSASLGLGRYPEASVYLAQARDLAEEIGSRPLLTRATANLGQAYSFTGRAEEGGILLTSSRLRIFNKKTT